MIIKKINHELTWPIRRKVMWPDKPLEYIKLENDEKGIHFGLYTDGELVSVISVFINNGEAQFRKFATLKKYQGKGYGTNLLEHIIGYLKEEGVKSVWCNARIEKKEFYKRFSLEETNETFERGDKKYIIMKRNI